MGPKTSMLIFPGWGIPQHPGAWQALVLNHVFSQALQLEASLKQHWPHLGVFLEMQALGPTTDLLRHLHFNGIPGRFVCVLNSAEEMRNGEGMVCDHAWSGVAFQKIEKPQKENVELREER